MAAASGSHDGAFPALPAALQALASVATYNRTSDVPWTELRVQLISRLQQLVATLNVLAERAHVALDVSAATGTTAHGHDNAAAARLPIQHAQSAQGDEDESQQEHDDFLTNGEPALEGTERILARVHKRTQRRLEALRAKKVGALDCGV